MTKPHFIYLLTDGEFQKAGRTQGPKRRLVGLQNGNPRRLSYLGLWHVTNAMAQHAENMCVVRFRHLWAFPAISRRRPTEWFSLEADIMGLFKQMLGEPTGPKASSPPIDIPGLPSSSHYLEAVR